MATKNAHDTMKVLVMEDEKMRGIDIASWQSGVNAATINADFVIIKATEGVGYVNPYCDTHYQQAKSAGKLRGIYHFARNSVNSAEAEAEFFLKNIQGYIKDAILILDWEEAVQDVAWAKRWLDYVSSKTGVKPMIYMSESFVNSYDWSSVAGADYALWVAKYRDYAADFNYNMELAGNVPSVKHWPFYAMWQWTSSGRLDGYNGNLDLNEFYGDAAAWQKYAGGSGTPQPVNPPAVPAPSVASEEVYTVSSGDTLSGIAAKYGVTWQHLQAINGIANANLIYPGQKIRIGKAQESRTYIVQSGDTLSGIAATFGTDWPTLQKINGIPDANLIHPGQVIRLP